MGEQNSQITTTEPENDFSNIVVQDVQPEPQPQPASGQPGTQPAEGGAPSPEPTATDNQPSTPAATQPAQAQPVTVVDPKALARELVAQQQANQPAPQLTDEQIDQVLRTVKVTEPEVEALFNADTPLAEKTAALQRMLVAAVENAVARNTVIMNDTVTKFYQNEFLPIANRVSAEAKRSAQDAFYTEYPGLADYKDAVTLVAGSLAKDPANFQLSGKAVAEKVAEQVTTLLRKTLPNFDPKIKSASGTQQAASVPTATTPSFSTGTKVVTSPATGNYPSSTPADSAIFGDEGLI